MSFISKLKKPACASKQDVLELATLQYLNFGFQKSGQLNNFIIENHGNRTLTSADTVHIFLSFHIFFLSAKKAGLKGNARTLIWIHSLREKAAAVESMLHKLQSLTIALKRKQQLGGGSKRNDYSAIAVATAIAGAGNVISKPTNTTSFSSSMESSSTSTKR